MSRFLPASLLLLLLSSACNPPDVGIPRPRLPIFPAAGGAAGTAPAAGTTGGVSGTGVAGTGWQPPAGGTSGIGGTAGAPSAGTGVPIGGFGSSGGTGGGAAQRIFDAGSDPNRNAVTAGMICERLATIQCAGEAFCCQSPGRDVPTCKQDIRSSCDMDAMVDDIAAAPASAFDTAQAQVVFTELERLASQCDPSIAAFGESFEGLRSIFRGTIGTGGNCRPSNPLNTTMAAAALASCMNYQQQACVPSLSTWTCTPHAAAGGHCFSDINCQTNLYCDNPSYSISGSDCKQRKGVGTACAADNECQTLFCRGGSCVAADAQAAYCLAAAP